MRLLCSSSMASPPGQMPLVAAHALSAARLSFSPCAASATAAAGGSHRKTSSAAKQPANCHRVIIWVCVAGKPLRLQEPRAAARPASGTLQAKEHREYNR